MPASTKAYSWLVDAYRCRLDDDMQRGRLRGLCEPGATAASIMLDFFVFCKLALANGVAPPEGFILGSQDADQFGLGETEGWAWSWDAFLRMARSSLLKAFNPEKCRAELRYGDRAGKGAEFRRVAATVYADSRGPGEAEAARRTLRELVGFSDSGRDEEGKTQHQLTFDRNPAVFAEVGGREAWKELLRAIGKGG